MDEKILTEQINSQLMIEQILTLFYCNSVNRVIDIYELEDVFKWEGTIMYISEVIDQLIKDDLIDDHIRNNIYTTLNYIRYNYPQYNDKINKLVMKLNCVELQTNIDFYKNQYYTRRGNSSFIERKIPDKYWPSITPDMKLSISRDYYYLDQLYSDEEDFKNEVLEDFALDYYFLYSTNYFCLKTPFVYTCQEIYMNTLSVLLHNELKLKGNPDISKPKQFKKINQSCLRKIEKL